MRLVDIIGSTLIASAVAAPLSCLPTSEPLNLQPFVAVAGAYALMEPPPAPPPVDGKCQNCNGVGRVSDGRVSVVCPVCDGTGKRTSKQKAAVSPPAQRAVTCATGNCQWPTRNIAH